MKRKIYYCILAVCLLCPIVLTAQTESKIYMQINGGSGLGVYYGLLDPGLAYAGGLCVGYKISDMFSIQTGINFEHKQTWNEILVLDINNEPIYNANIKHSFEFINVPVLANFQFGNKVSYFVNAGPYFSYLMKQEMLCNDELQNISTQSENSDSYNRLGGGVSVGVGINIPLNEKLDLSFGFKNNLDIINMSDFDGATFKTNTTLLLAGLTLSL